MTNSKDRQKKAANETKRKEQKNAIRIPSHVNVIGFDDDIYEAVTKVNPDAYKKAKGSVLSLWSHGQKLRHNTFVEVVETNHPIHGVQYEKRDTLTGARLVTRFTH